MITSKSLSGQSGQDLRHELRWRRRIKLGQSLWRFLSLTGLIAATGWVVTRPSWLINDPSQLVVQGNQLLTTETVKSLFPVHYPQSLWWISPSDLTQELEQILPIEQAELTRTVLPPQLIITIKEREPVALVMSADLPQTTNVPSLILVGFLDSEGVLIPEHFYPQAFPLSLKVIGFQSQHQSAWQIIYKFIESKLIEVKEVDWRDPNTLILKTSLGEVRCGNYLAQLPEQLSALTKLKSLPQQVNLAEIDHIDLTNPAKPTVKLLPKQD